MEVWTRFMRTAHQGVAVAACRGGSGGLLSNLFQSASQVSEPAPRTYQPSAQAPVPLAPIPSGGGYREHATDAHLGSAT